MTRWLRWTFLCWRGRRCADIVLGELQGDPPTGALVVIEYNCCRCRTPYRRTAVVGNDGDFAQSERERAIA